jgi:hypothetical protein
LVFVQHHLYHLTLFVLCEIFPFCDTMQAYTISILTCIQMKFTVLPIMAMLGTTLAEDAECKEKTDTCQNRVEVFVTDLVHGLKDDVPVEVYEAFVTASSQCLSCVEKTDVEVLTETADESTMSLAQCRRAGCWCCLQTWCQRNDGSNYCPEQCYDDFPKCDSSSRRLTGEDDGNPYFINYELDVCMDVMTPLDTSSSSYVDHTQMLEDFEKELATCYEDKDTFLNSWSSLCADSGIDLSLMARTEGDSRTITFGSTGIDMENAVMTTYSSDDSHRSTSHMIFYSALGFVTLSAFAVIGTAVVVKVLNKRKEAEKEQEAKWVSEMVNVDTANPVATA